MTQYIFGPVPSRRLGFSLGVDTIPYKTCSLDCIYCQLGKTTNKTATCCNFVAVSDVINELKKVLSEKPHIDFITLSGSGEPTLFSDIDKLIEAIKEESSVPVALLTNGTLLWKKEIRDKIMQADVVIPSLDAGDEQTFLKINRPCDQIRFDTYVQGLIDFSREFKGEIRLEVFLVKGVNDSEDSVKKIAALAKNITHTSVELNTITRPAAELGAKAVSNEKLHEIALLFSGKVVVISDFDQPNEKSYKKPEKDEIIELLKRRPCTEADITEALLLHRNEVAKLLEVLLKDKIIIDQENNGSVYYKYKRT